MVDGLRIALVGRFAGMRSKEAANVLRSLGAIVVDQKASEIDWIVVGDSQTSLMESDLLSSSIRQAIATGSCELIHESDLWQRLGWINIEHTRRKLYTPAMLANLLNVSVRVIRRWQRLGLIKPVETMHQLPYFDFVEVATAKRLASWIAEGESPKLIEARLAQWVELLPDIHRPLDQLSILVHGKQVLLRHGEGLISSDGQLHFDFDAEWDANTSLESVHSRDAHQVISMIRPEDSSFLANDGIDDEADALIQAAHSAEDADDLQTAIDFYHAILARDGPRAEIHFQIGELLYRLGERIAARERYYAAIEVDPDLVEARASLGIVLAETGQLELAVAAMKGAIEVFADYADVHYHLARALEELSRNEEAKVHWSRFLTLSPESPWAEEAKERLSK